jgi:hypothetical protein
VALADNVSNRFPKEETEREKIPQADYDKYINELMECNMKIHLLSNDKLRKLAREIEDDTINFINEEDEAKRREMVEARDKRGATREFIHLAQEEFGVPKNRNAQQLGE